ncbi:MAG TPA: Coenzyme F420 hydrogenase/dehydrogenase, beta subunit C-terminal domain [Nitriliruptorales bacterium]|nr:Coenzyme F420 hydrogenase/dehydrogenase, beta subunit C-terminal domain [Nitriliruptorales bacterium]
MGDVHWRELYREVVDTGLCTGCAACVMACPQDVLGYTHDYLPVQIGEGMGVDQCVTGDRGCDICTRACPRFRAWESEFEQELFGRPRRADELHGVARTLLLTQASDDVVHRAGQDGGLVSTLLIWGLETGRIDGALTSRIVDAGRGPFDAEPFLATSREEVLATAGSRYTYSANPLAMKLADERRLKQIALVGMSCQASINGSVAARGVNKYKRKIALSIGLLCSKTFTYEGQQQVLADHGIHIDDVAKVNVKGRFMVWTRDGAYHEIPLKELHPHTRPGCKLCPDFAAEHADISTGGIGADDDWTLTIVRTARGEEWLAGVIDAGLIQTRPADQDPVAMNVLDKLSATSRKRWPGDLLPEAFRAPGVRPTA